MSDRTTVARSWTDAEDTFLVEYYYSHTRDEIGRLLGRTEGSVRKRCSTLGLNTKKSPNLSPEEVGIIRQWFTERKNTPKGEFNLQGLVEKLGRSEITIERYAKAMELTRYNRKHSDAMCDVQSVNAKKQIAAKGHPRGMLGKKHSEETKAKQSKISKRAWKNKTPLDRELMIVKRNKTTMERYGTGNPSMKGTNGYSRTRKGKRPDLDNLFFRSSWEANYARYLNWLKAQGKIKDWQYEVKTFVFEGVTRGVLTYTPDFKVIEMDDTYAWHEVKGWMDSKSKAKLKRMAKFYPDETVILIGAAEYKELSKWAAILPGWE